MPEIKGLPKYEPKPGTNPLRAMTIQLLREMASDPTALEVTPLGGMTRALKGTPAYHGFYAPKEYADWGAMLEKAKGILETQHGPKWALKVKRGTLADLTEKLLKQEQKKLRKEHVFDKFDPKKAGKGAGGNLYDEGIYLAGHPEISKGYGNFVRKHNIPPQAKILDVDTPLSNADLDAIARMEDTNAFGFGMRDFIDRAIDKGKARPTLGDILRSGVLPRSFRQPYKLMAKRLGYDGISYNAGRISRLPKGVPEGTKNYVIYNYDVINNPRKLAPKPKPQPEKALRRFPSERDKYLQHKYEATQKAMRESRPPTREEVEYMLKKRGIFSY